MTAILDVLWYAFLALLGLIAIGGIAGGWLFLLMNVAVWLEERRVRSRA